MLTAAHSAFLPDIITLITKADNWKVSPSSEPLQFTSCCIHFRVYLEPKSAAVTTVPAIDGVGFAEPTQVFLNSGSKNECYSSDLKEMPAHSYPGKQRGRRAVVEVWNWRRGELCFSSSPESEMNKTESKHIQHSHRSAHPGPSAASKNLWSSSTAEEPQPSQRPIVQQPILLLKESPACGVITWSCMSFIHHH